MTEPAFDEAMLEKIKALPWEISADENVLTIRRNVRSYKEQYPVNIDAESVTFLEELQQKGLLEFNRFTTGNPKPVAQEISARVYAKTEAHKALYDAALPAARARLEKARAAAPDWLWHTHQVLMNQPPDLAINMRFMSPEQIDMAAALGSAGEITSSSGMGRDYLNILEPRHALYESIKPKAEERGALPSHWTKSGQER